MASAAQSQKYIKEPTMKTMKVYSEENLFREDHETEPSTAECAELSTSAGSFSLRRAYYFAETGKLLMSIEQQRALANLIRESDPGTKQKVIILNLRLVVSLAKRYTHRGLELIDLVREGNQGLIEALERFKSVEDSRFTVFATWCICQRIEHAILQQNTAPKSFQPTPVPVVAFVNTARTQGEHNGFPT
jgi:DNA-directed RNA polymerase sigma subunit (sigma70/sigma32)